MPIEGAALFQSLSALLAEQTQMVERGQESLANIECETNDLLDQRSKSLLSLAQHFLPELTRNAIEGNFDGLRGDLLAILAQKESRRRELKNANDATQGENRTLQESIDAVTKLLDTKVIERGKLEAQVAQILKTNSDFQERSKLALQAEERLHRNEQRVSEMRKEAEEKLPLYEKSPLFRYLLAREWGSSTYQKKGMIAELDRWVAGMIHFGEARAGYDFLKNTPPLVEEEVNKRREQFNALMAQAEAIEKIEADKIGLTAVLQEGDKLGTQRDDMVKALEGLNQKAADAQNELKELEEGRDAFYRKALERFGTFLGQTRIALLEQRARQTPEPEDDAIVAEIGAMDGRLADLKANMQGVGEARRAGEAIRDGLGQILQRYRASNYDSGRCYFEDYPSIPQACGDFQAGRLDLEGLWGTLQQAQRFRPNWVQSSAEVVASPTGRVILGAVLDLAGSAMQAAAYRGVQRRDSFPFPTGNYGGSTSWSPPSSSSGGSSEGSFTTGDGF